MILFYVVFGIVFGVLWLGGLHFFFVAPRLARRDQRGRPCGMHAPPQGERLPPSLSEAAGAAAGEPPRPPDPEGYRLTSVEGKSW